MSFCVVGIIGLQLFWNYQNYKSTVKVFDHDINEALNKAVDRETDQRQDQIVARFKKWLADTSFITITCDYNNHDSATVFHTRDTHPKFKGGKSFTFGLADFTKKLKRITPEAKAYMINHFGDMILKDHLKQGVIYNYTQKLGDSLDKVFKASRVNKAALGKLFKEELAQKNIRVPFAVNPRKGAMPYLTHTVNSDLRKPYHTDLVYAGFESPNSYFFKEMKWVIVSSLLLIAITLCCFTYTVKTLLSQHKLAALKDDFINNMTHELNTPLASIKITAEALKSFDHNPHTRLEYLDIISYQVDKLTGLTGQILNTGKLLKASERTWTGINLNELVQKAIFDLKPQSDKQGALINYTGVAKELHIKGETTSLLNAFTNIIDNALKYTTRSPKVDINLSSCSGYAEIAFSDNGIGIPGEYRDKVFENFFRVPQGNTHNVKGYGLGLSYVSQVIKQHKGVISLSANQPYGSTIVIKLPLS